MDKIKFLIELPINIVELFLIHKNLIDLLLEELDINVWWVLVTPFYKYFFDDAVIAVVQLFIFIYFWGLGDGARCRINKIQLKWEVDGRLQA